MSDLKTDVVSFLVKSNALKFGEFTLKSGRRAPYFINAGAFNSGASISQLGDFYARLMVDRGLDSVDTIFGPAYKGIPLCVAASISLKSLYQKNIGFTFNRKEEKTHGDKGVFVGYPLQTGVKTVIVEDVVTAGTTLNEVVPMLRGLGVEISGTIIIVDRCERGAKAKKATTEAEEELGIKILSLVTIHDIVSILSSENPSGLVLTAEQLAKINSYLSEYGENQ